MRRVNPLGGIYHDGEYNPWDMSPEQQQLADECRSSGGFVFRTGAHDIRTGMHYGDGLHFVRFMPSEADADNPDALPSPTEAAVPPAKP